MQDVKYETVKFGDKKFIIRTFYNIIDMDDVVSSFKYMLSEGMISGNCVGMISDLSNAELGMDISELEEMLNFIKNNETISSIKLAVVGNSPEKIMYPTLANLKIGDKLIPFSDMDDAIKWIKEE